tara:strand:+ start:173 stop:703 length:531 start_codon:yes stop_codon:yes gene_type:complete
MNNIEQIEITHQANGKKKKVQVSWLLSNNANWYMDAQPFLITDSKIGDKLHGEFSGKPVKVRMLSKYPYLKSRLEDYEEERQENQAAPVGNDEPTETEETEATNQGGIESFIDEATPEQEERLGEHLEDLDAITHEQIMLMSVTELKEHLNVEGVKYDKRKKALDYFQKLALQTIK